MSSKTFVRAAGATLIAAAALVGGIVGGRAFGT